MKFRIVSVGDVFDLECSFGLTWLGRLFGQKEEWHWVNSYSDLKSAERGRDYLASGFDPNRKVVG